MWFLREPSAPGRERSWSPARQAEGEDSTGAERVLGAPGRPAAWPLGPLGPSCSLSQDTLAASLRERSFLWTPGVGRLRARGINSPSPAARDKINQPGPPPQPGPRPCWERSAWVCAWNASSAGATALQLPSPRIFPRPLRPSLFFRLRGAEARVGDAKGTGGPSEPRVRWRAAQSAGPVTSSAHYLRRIVDVAVVRAYAARWPCSGARDLRGGCGSRPFSNLIGLVVMWSAEASTITRGMFS